MTAAPDPTPIVCLAGPTAAGKSAAVLALARRWPIEIINVDSATIYRGMDIGTAKPTRHEQALTPQHLLDIRDPAQSYSAAEFVRDTHALIAGIRARGKIPVLAGGTMLYFKALRDGLDELPQADPVLRAELSARAALSGWPALHAELTLLDPVTAQRLAPGDSQRIQRALEICILSNQPMSALLSRHRKEKTTDATQDSDSPGRFATRVAAPGRHPAIGPATCLSAPRDAQATSPDEFTPQAGDGAHGAGSTAGAEADRGGLSATAKDRAAFGDDRPEGAQAWLTISLEPSDRLALHARIAQRFEAMMSAGLLAEVARLRERPDLNPGLPSIRCVGYRQMWHHLAGEVDYDTAVEQAMAATRQLAKRQLTWLRSQPDRHAIDCLRDDASDQVVNRCATVFEARARA